MQMRSEPLHSLLPATPEIELRRAIQCDALWNMTADERVAAMWRGDLSHFQLRVWSAEAPQEVPRITTDLTPSGELGEFAWIVMGTPEWAEAVAREKGAQP